MDKKIAELTEKLYMEGVQKGEEEKRNLIDTARKEAENIRAEARKDAERIISEAKVQATELRRNAESEIRLSGQQAISALKQQILELVSVKAVDATVGKTLEDPAVVKDLILALLGNWKDSQTYPSIEIILPENRKAELEKSFEGSVRGILKNGVTVSFSRNIRGGFQIVPSGSTYRISMTDEDFSNLFKEYLRPKARAFLFGE